MKYKALTLISFSPTGTTLKVLKEVGRGMGIDNIQLIDLTKPNIRNSTLPDIEGDIVVIGVPVYEERIPDIINANLQELNGLGRPVVLIAMYGNVGEGIVLKQLEKITKEKGFIIAAAASFIGEHSFSNEHVQLAVGRPDEKDLMVAYKFGKKVMEKIEKKERPEEYTHLNLMGSLPIMARILPKNSARHFTYEPEVNKDKCTNCGLCIKTCPVNAINEESLEINKDICLRCFACVRVCPCQAREIRYKNEMIVANFLKKAGKIRKEPRIYI